MSLSLPSNLLDRTLIRAMSGRIIKRGTIISMMISSCGPMNPSKCMKNDLGVVTNAFFDDNK